MNHDENMFLRAVEGEGMYMATQPKPGTGMSFGRQVGIFGVWACQSYVIDLLPDIVCFLSSSVCLNFFLSYKFTFLY